MFKLCIWFFPASYSYINPVGVKEHIKFLVELPIAFTVFYIASRKDIKDTDNDDITEL